ncbi:hypothetical protein MKX01_037088 [Papaver californicum]|nr:hypothetical protein MKX01_037088 [Papaver californicum]
MGVCGTMEYLSDLMSSTHKHKKKKQMQTVELKIKMDCDGVKSVDINRKQNKVTVTGYVEASKVVKKARSTGKKVEIWPYVPYNLVLHPYIAQAYDKKAPPGYARNVEITSTATSNMARHEDNQYTTMFSDDNPNACSIM